MVMLLSVGNVWGAEQEAYTLTPATGSNNSYASNCDVTISGIKWNVTGNASLIPWRLGGKSLSGVDRAVYSKTAMSDAITKVELVVGAASSITVNSVKLIVASNADFSTKIDEVSKTTFAANSTITFAPTSPATQWAKNAYYKFVFNVSVSGTSNKFVEFKSAKFYTEASKTLSSITISGTPKVTYEEGEFFDYTGLVATGHYDDSSEENLTSSVAWAYTPAGALTQGLNSVNVTATSGNIVGNKDVGITVNAHVVTPGEYSITFCNAFFGTSGLNGSLSGSNLKDYSGSKDDITVEYKKGTGSNMYLKDSEIRLYSGNTLVITAPSGYNITSVTGLKNTMTANEGTITGTEWSGESNSVTFSHANSTGNSALTTISVTYEEAGANPKAAKPTFETGDESFLTSTSVTLACETTGAIIYYTTDGNDPTTSSSVYSSAIPVSTTTTIKAIAVADGYDNSAVAEKTFTKITPLTVADALAATPSNNKYVKGIIATITEVSTQHKNATYTLKDEGQENSIIIYRGKYLNNTDFTSEDQIAVGDEVTVFGNLVEYKSVNQFAQDNYIVALKPAAKLAWSEASYEAELEGENTFPTLTNTNSVTVTYSSSNADAATIDENTGAITLVAAGTTTITAVFAGNETYKANSVSYTLEVKNAVIRANISFEENGGTAVTDLTQQSNLPNPLPVITKAGKNFGGWFTDSELETPAVAGAAVTSTAAITLYAKWLEPYSVAEALGIIDELEDDGQTENSVYVAGIVCTAPTSNPNSGKLTFYISENGVESDRLQAYNCKGLNNANFEAKTDIQVMDELVIYGPLKKYIKNNQPVPEFNTGYLYSFNRPAVQTYSITYVENGANEDIEDVAEATNLPDPLPTVTKNEKSFGGWFTTATFEAGSEAVAGAPLSKDETLYAKWNDLSQWATTYTSNVTIGTDVVKFSNEELAPTYAAKKTGTGSAWGSTTVTVPTNTTKLHFHAVCYGADAQAVILNVKKGESVLGTFNINKDAGAKGNSPFILENTPYAQYYYVNLSEITEPTEITFEADDSAGKRFIIFGVNQEGGILPVLQSLEISGDLENKTYEAGAAINPAGLTVMGTYTLGGTPQAPVDVTDQVEDWLYDALQAGDETVTISAKIGTVTSAGYEISGLTVTDPTPRFETNPASYISFGSKEQGATITARDLEVTLVNVSNASVEITGTGAAAFSVDEDALTGNATLHVSASSANVGTFAATLTISDEAGAAADKEISLSLTVTAPVVEETAVSTTSEWIAATDADLVDGAEVLITGATGGVTYAIGVQNDNNRAAVAGTLEEGVFTPGENTMSFTLVAQEEEGVFALQASNGEYLYAASSAKNYLKRQATLDDNAKWTLTATSAVANGSNTHNDLKFNATNSPKIFSCYTGGQTAIQFYVPKPVTPTKYNVTIVDMIDNGTVESDKTEAEEGESVTLTITANAGFELTELWVNMDNVVSSVSAGSYTFSMPDEDVTISALFTQIPDPSYTEVRNGLNAGEYYTMCLDKAVISVKAGSIWRVLSKAQNGTDIILEEVTTTVAGRPYIIYATETTFEVEYTGDAVGAPVNDDDNNGLIGSFSQVSIANNPNNYIIYNNALYIVNSDNVYVGEHRAYLNMGGVPAYNNEPQQGNAPRRRVTMAVHGPQVATGIDALNASDAPAKVLINGQLFIIRGEKMFDAKGQLVK